MIIKDALAIHRQIPYFAPEKTRSYHIFDRISPNYDFLNHFLSLGIDIHWRKQAVEELHGIPDALVLDLACGTGDLYLTSIKRIPTVRRVLGIDPSEKMLNLGKQKTAAKNYTGKVHLLQGNGLSLPVKNNLFDAAMIAFGIRNIPDPLSSLSEIRRVLKPGGKLIILEFALPDNPILKKLYLLYFRHIMPFLGGVISGDFRAYRYLNRTVENFPYGEEFLSLMRQSGFEQTRFKSLSGGIAMVYVGFRR